MKLELRDNLRRGRGRRRDAFVVFSATPKGKGKAFENVPAEVRARAAAAAPAEPGAEGALFTVPLGRSGPAERLYVFGVGKDGGMSPRKARGLLRNVVKTLHRNGERSAILDFPFALQRMSPGETRDFLARTLLLGDYTFRRYKTGEPEKRPLTAVAWNPRGAWRGVRPAEAARELKQASTVARVAALMRDLGNTPANDLRPRDFAGRARKEARSRGVRVRVLDRKAIARERMGGLLAVSRGSAEEPRLVVLEWAGGRKGAAPVALVGKGVTFDSGGYSLKPSNAMEDMKVDMSGAAAVISAIDAIATLGCEHEVHAVAACCENLVSGRAYKLGDVLTSMDGTTVEINNTDAEGRLTLGDAITYVRTKVQPDEMFDFATLTGACMVALGPYTAGVMSDHEGLCRAWLSAAERAGEDMWRLPLTTRLREQLKSPVADMRNTGDRFGGAITAGLFLKTFAKDTPWVHVDIAGPASLSSSRPFQPRGGTGFAVASIVEYLAKR